MGRRVAVIVLSMSVALALVPAGRAHDSQSPPGRAHTWLPEQDWVRGHWIPFDEQELKRALGLRGRELEAYLYNDHHTLADLARRRGIDPMALADRLLLPWGEGLEGARLKLLRRRTIRILTDGHLAQHVFFHVFHGVPVRAARPPVFGVPGEEYWRLRLRGRTPLAIARRGGVSPALARERMVTLFRAEHDEGVRLGQAWPGESARILARQLRALPCWLRRPDPPHDAGNPYGKARFVIGGHGRGWPGTPAERRRADRRAERFRRSLPRSCWRPPPAWSWRAYDSRPPAPNS